MKIQEVPPVNTVLPPEISTQIWNSPPFSHFNSSRESKIIEEHKLSADSAISCITSVNYPMGQTLVGDSYAAASELIADDGNTIITYTKLGSSEPDMLSALGTVHISGSEVKRNALLPILDAHLEKLPFDSVIIIEDHPNDFHNPEDALDESEFAYVKHKAKGLGLETLEPDPTKGEIILECQKAVISLEEYFVSTVWGDMRRSLHDDTLTYVNIGLMIARRQKEFNRSSSGETLKWLQSFLQEGRKTDQELSEYFGSLTPAEQNDLFELIGRRGIDLIAKKMSEMDKVDLIDTEKIEEGKAVFNQKVVQSYDTDVSGFDKSQRLTERIHSVINYYRNTKFLEAIYANLLSGRKVFVCLGEAHVIELSEAMDLIIKRLPSKAKS